MSNKTRTTLFVLAISGCIAFMVMPWTNAQEKKTEKLPAAQSVVNESSKSSDSPGYVKKDAVHSSAKAATSKDEISKATTKKGNSKAAKTSSDAPKSTANTLRLPRYFSGLVDEEQREAVYAIQLEYRTKIVELEEELARVRQDEQVALEKLLTDSQRKLLAKKRSQATESTRGRKTADETESDDGSMNP